MMKGYVLPYEKDHVLMERDYSQQEFRILAHYEDGPLLGEVPGQPAHGCPRCGARPDSGDDGHNPRPRPVKDVGFSLIYGMGLDELARKIERDRQGGEGAEGNVPERYARPEDLQNEDQARRPRQANRSSRGAGGSTTASRQSYNKKFKRWMTYEYKLINRLIQGSAADCTKEGTARYHELPERKRVGGLFLMTVHDSTVCSAAQEAGARPTAR
jgi:DNA polymerase I-like protein with 3'-5' exonuclease and polymerase domains